ncbi:MAG: Kdo hydroxylase family protein [Gemmataceae bacterium]
METIGGGKGPEATELLERGELVVLPVAPFPLPSEDDHSFLLEQKAGGLGRKHICFDPHTSRLTGCRCRDMQHESRLRDILSGFHRAVTSWVEESLPSYRSGLQVDRTTFRPDEEATRRLRPHARNDLLHVDAFPGRPARGRRILRVFVNIHPTEERVWATSEPLPAILERYSDRFRHSTAGWFHELGARLFSAFQPDEQRPDPSDLYMLRLHDFLKNDMDFQQRGPRRLWRFPPGSAWMAMTDACTYAELRGRFAMEQSFFVSQKVLQYPELAPARLLSAA